MNDNIICEADCPVCGEVVKFSMIGFLLCPHCGEAQGELTVNWEIIEENQDVND